MAKTPDAILSLHRLKIINCNCISSPITWGFPAIFAFAGFTEALNRKIKSKFDFDIDLRGVGVVCHAFDPQVNKAEGKFELTFKQTRNPLEKKSGGVKSASTQEEGRCYIEVSLLIGIYGDLDDEEEDELKDYVLVTVQTMRVAGGSILPAVGREYEVDLIGVSSSIEKREEEFRKLRRKLIPGFSLVSRGDYLAAHVEELQKDSPDVTSLDALVDLSRLNSKCAESPVLRKTDDPDKPQEIYEWEVQRKPGWFVPIPVGYVGISELYGPGEVARCRDSGVPAQFVEAVYSLGEWVSPHRIHDVKSLLWFYDYSENDDLYLLVNNYQESINI